MSVSEESRGVSDGGRTRGNCSAFVSNNGVNTVDTNRGKLGRYRSERKTFSSFEEYLVILICDSCAFREFSMLCYIDGYSTRFENECQPLFSN